MGAEFLHIAKQRVGLGFAADNSTTAEVTAVVFKGGGNSAISILVFADATWLPGNSHKHPVLRA